VADHTNTLLTDRELQYITPTLLSLSHIPLPPIPLIEWPRDMSVTVGIVRMLSPHQFLQLKLLRSIKSDQNQQGIKKTIYQSSIVVV